MRSTSIGCGTSSFVTRRLRRSPPSGYARTTGRVGVCCATSGPGATNLVTGLLDAMMDSVPVVAITGQVRTELMGTDGFQEADVCAITQAVTKRNMLVSSAEHIGPTIAERSRSRAAAGRARSWSTSRTTFSKRPQRRHARRRNARAEGAGPRVSDAAVRDAVARICSARRPVAIVGGGARAGAVAAYRMFAAMLDSRTPRRSTPWARRRPAIRFLACWACTAQAADPAVSSADLIIALGMRFDDRVTGRPSASPRRGIIHADIDPSEFGKIIPVDVALRGDLHDTLSRLRRAASKPMSYLHEWAAEARPWALPRPATAPPTWSFPRPTCSMLLRPLAGRRDRHHRRRPASDVGRAAHAASDPRNFITSAGLGAMGFGLPSAIGAHLGSPAHCRSRSATGLPNDAAGTGDR